MSNPSLELAKDWKFEVEPTDEGVTVTMLVAEGEGPFSPMSRFMDINIDAMHADQLLAGLALALDRRRRDRRAGLSVVR